MASIAGTGPCCHRVVEVARQRNLVAAAMTFEPHPREYFAPEQAPARIANLRDKIEGLRSAGIEWVLVQHFNRDFASLSPERFIQRILVEGCRARWLAVGDDFRFGAARAGDVAMLRSAGEGSGFTIEQIAPVLVGGERVSSSRIRAALSEGDLALAGDLLGHPYAISGRVLHGSKLGRQIGFPTLNLRVAHRRPALHGIYAVRVQGIGRLRCPAWQASDCGDDRRQRALAAGGAPVRLLGRGVRPADPGAVRAEVAR